MPSLHNLGDYGIVGKRGSITLQMSPELTNRLSKRLPQRAAGSQKQFEQNLTSSVQRQSSELSRKVSPVQSGLVALHPHGVQRGQDASFAGEPMQFLRKRTLQQEYSDMGGEMGGDMGSEMGSEMDSEMGLYSQEESQNPAENVPTQRGIVRDEEESVDTTRFPVYADVAGVSDTHLEPNNSKYTSHSSSTPRNNNQTFSRHTTGTQHASRAGADTLRADSIAEKVSREGQNGVEVHEDGEHNMVTLPKLPNPALSSAHHERIQTRTSENSTHSMDSTLAFPPDLLAAKGDGRFHRGYAEQGFSTPHFQRRRDENEKTKERNNANDTNNVTTDSFSIAFELPDDLEKINVVPSKTALKTQAHMSTPSRVLQNQRTNTLVTSPIGAHFSSTADERRAEKGKKPVRYWGQESEHESISERDSVHRHANTSLASPIHSIFSLSSPPRRNLYAEKQKILQQQKRQDDRVLRDLSRTSLLLEEQHRRARKAAESKLLRQTGRQFHNHLVSHHATLDRASAATLKSQNILANASLAEEALRRRKMAEDKAAAEKTAQLRSLSRLQSNEKRMNEVARAKAEAVERARELAMFRARERDLRWEREVLQPVAAAVAETWAKADAAQARVAEEERRRRVHQEAEMSMAETRQRGKLENARAERNAYKKEVERERLSRVHHFYTSQGKGEKTAELELGTLERDFHRFFLTKPVSALSASSASSADQRDVQNHPNLRDNMRRNGNEYKNVYGSEFTADLYTQTQAMHQELSPPAISRASQSHSQSQSFERREQKRENVQLAIS